MWEEGGVWVCRICGLLETGDDYLVGLKKVQEVWCDSSSVDGYLRSLPVISCHKGTYIYVRVANYRPSINPTDPYTAVNYQLSMPHIHIVNQSNNPDSCSSDNARSRLRVNDVSVPYPQKARARRLGYMYADEANNGQPTPSKNKSLFNGEYRVLRPARCYLYNM